MSQRSNRIVSTLPVQAIRLAESLWLRGALLGGLALALLLALLIHGGAG
ncbi:MAG TPA: hypothetical protein VF292_13065 [Rhodanobacteraceae bacterium]